MADIQRIKPQTAWEHAQHGDALLVCAYDDERWHDNKLAGAIPLWELEDMKLELEYDQEIVLYCA